MNGASSTQFSTNLRMVTQINLGGLFFDGLLAKLPAILDSFSLAVLQVITWGWLVKGGGEPQRGGESTHCVATLVLLIHWCLKWPKK